MINAIKEIHNISRPGHEPQGGDYVEIECVGGFICEVDPHTQAATNRHRQFVIAQPFTASSDDIE